MSLYLLVVDVETDADGNYRYKLENGRTYARAGLVKCSEEECKEFFHHHKAGRTKLTRNGWWVIISELVKKANSLSSYKVDAIQAAKDFDYGDVVIHQIEDAKSNDEVCRIMRDARHAKWGD